VLPGGKAVLFTSNTNVDNFEDSDLVVYSMASRQRKTVHRGGFHARYLPAGYLVYMHEGTLFAVPFDLKRLEVTGQPASILEGVVSNPATGGAHSECPTPAPARWPMACRQCGTSVSGHPETPWR
jgi:hypothetical protein